MSIKAKVLTSFLAIVLLLALAISLLFAFRLTLVPLLCDELAGLDCQLERLDLKLDSSHFTIDIGEVSARSYEEIILKAKTIFWNGPMGVFELPSFAAGTRTVADAVAEASDNGALSVVGGGDSVAAANQFGVSHRIGHISTGGGASLELLAGRQLPGIEALSDV